MRIEKIINNNLVKAKKGDREVLVMGKGIGFQAKAGDQIPVTSIEKVYELKSSSVDRKLSELLDRIPYPYIRVTNEIIHLAQTTLGKELGEQIYLTLTDHICFALDRHKKGIHLPNALQWEIKRLYHNEFQIGLDALELVRERLDISLPEDEAGFIALHIVNAQMDRFAMEQTMEMTRMIRDIQEILRFHYGRSMDEESIHYDRFVTHLRYFVQRLYYGAVLKDEDLSFVEMIREKYPFEYQCALKIGAYVKNEKGMDLTPDELMYLTIHIKRITMDS